LFRDLAKINPWFQKFECNNTAEFIAVRRATGSRVLLEGAQGQGLSLIHGPWPYCTSTDPGPAQLASDVGIPPTQLGRMIACMRTFPIRVAGNSGPLPNEIGWDQLSQMLGRTVSERTTVTKKIRRVAMWDDQIARACRILHGPTEIALTFVDYLNATNEGVDDVQELSDSTHDFIRNVEEVMCAPVTFIGTGGPELTVIRCNSQWWFAKGRQ
jgi:adenylosuccinate synthase